MRKLLVFVLACALTTGANADITDQLVSIPTGDSQYDTTVANNLERLVIRFKRCTDATPLYWCDMLTTLSVFVSRSVDDGATYQRVCGLGGMPGGIYINKDGNQQPENVLICCLYGTNPATGRCRPKPGGTPTTRIRADATVTNGPLVTEVTLEAR